MIVLMNTDVEADDPRVRAVVEKALRYGLKPEVNPEQGTSYTVVQVYLKDDEKRCSAIPEFPFEIMQGVHKVERVSPSAVSIAMNGGREPHRIKIGNSVVGQGLPCLPVFGQCTLDRHVGRTVESLMDHGIPHQRGCPDKPRSRAGSFYGFGERGLLWFFEAAKANGVESVWLEVMDTSNINTVRKVRDQTRYDGDIVLWVGARTGNQILLQELGRQQEFIVMLKHGVRARSVEEVMNSAGYVLEGPVDWNEDGSVNTAISRVPGNNRLIICVRGLEKTDPHLDLRFYPNYAWINELHEQTWAPICFDPSHIAGDISRVFDVASQGLLHNPDVLMIEVHPNPEDALCDGDQAVPLDRVPELLELVEDHNCSFAAEGLVA